MAESGVTADAPRSWYLLAEDSCKPFPHIRLHDLQQQLALAKPETEILQLGCRFIVTKGAKLHKLDLDTMQYDLSPPERVPRRTCGQKLLAVTPMGLHLLARRLLRGPAAYFDHCIGELQRNGVVETAAHPIAGSRAHFSLVLNGTPAMEEMPSTS